MSNLVAIVVSVGLLSPWAKVRMYRYRLACTQAIVKGDLDSFAAGQQEEVSALGQEIGDVFDFDIGI